MSFRIAVSAGEVSGDQHLARVVSALCVSNTVKVKGMAGKACRNAGAEILVDCYTQGSAMGFSELFRSAGGIFRSFRKMSDLLKTWRPHLLIVVDYPDFNLRLAERAHRIGVPVLYFIPPKIWAWRARRIERIKRHVDHVAAIFPFEKDFYAARGYDAVTYVGHPLAEARGAAEPPEARRENMLLMLPGSRRFEVEKLLPPMLRVFSRLANESPDLKGVVLAAPNMDPAWLRGVAEAAVGAGTAGRVIWSTGDALSEMRRARAGILKSGTCNLEGALAELPFVSVYSGSLMTRIVVDLLVPLKEFSPVNIIRGGTVRELMQMHIDEHALESEMRELLLETERRRAVESGLKAVRAALLSSDVGQDGRVMTISERVAAIALDLATRGTPDVQAHT